MYFQNEIIKCPYFSVLLFYSVLITTLYVLSYVLFIRCENTRKNKYDSCNANNSYSSFTAGNICDTVLLFFFFLSAAYMNNPHSTGGPQSTPALGTGGHPFVGPQPTLSTPVSELSRICSLVGMSQPDFSFIKTPQVKLVFCKS